MKNFTILVLCMMVSYSATSQVLDLRIIDPSIEYGTDVTDFTPRGGFYAKIPIEQVSTYKFGVVVKNDNEDVVTTSVVLNVVVTKGSTIVYDENSSALTSIPGKDNTDTTEITIDSLFHVTDASYLGWYNITFNVIENSSDTIYKKSWFFETTKDVYARDSGNVNALNVSPNAYPLTGAGDDMDRLNVIYDLFDTATIAGIWVHVYEFTDVGVDIAGHIMKWVGPGNYFDDGSISVAWIINNSTYADRITTETYELNEEDIGSWVYLPIIENNDILPRIIPEQYCTSVEIFYHGGLFSVSRSTVNNDVHAKNAAWLMAYASLAYAALDEQTAPLIAPNIPSMRMQLLRDECDGFTDVLIDKKSDIDTCAINAYGYDGYAFVDIESPNGGLSYQWTSREDPTFSSTNDTLITDERGAYSVLITDSEGCVNHTNVYMDYNLGSAEYLADLISLEQNAPNPFSDYTIIRYELMEEAEIQLVVTDIMGATIEYIDEGNQYPGAYVVELDGANYTSGVYYYSLIVNGHKLTRKMIVAK